MLYGSKLIQDGGQFINSGENIHPIRTFHLINLKLLYPIRVDFVCVKLQS